MGWRSSVVPVPGGLSTHTAGPYVSTPVFFKLSRRGHTVFASYKLARTDPWTLLGADASEAFGEAVLVGVAVTSHTDGTLATGLFTELEVSPAREFTSADIGSVTEPGRSEGDILRTRLLSAGADIWGSADAFHFHYTRLSGNGRITARVLSLDPTDPWAKAGIMFRGSLDPDAQHVFAFVSPGRGVSVQYRGVAGGASTQARNVPGAAPVWLRLTRSGIFIVAEVSTDGSLWTVQNVFNLGGVAVAFGTDIYVGLALTSHNESVAAVAEFEDVSVTTQ